MYIINQENRGIRINHGPTLIEVKPFGFCEVPAASVQFVKSLQASLKLQLSDTPPAEVAAAPVQAPKIEAPAEPVVAEVATEEATTDEEASVEAEASEDAAPKVTTRRRRRDPV